MKLHLAFAALLVCVATGMPAMAAESALPMAAKSTAAPAALPADIVWETNNDDPPIGSPKAIRGGRFNQSMSSYPLTFRLVGPNANGSFAVWLRQFALMELGLVARHPSTDNYIPILATHWSIQKDQKTVYYKLDPNATWSDGKPITADDYVATLHMFQAKEILDPFYNLYAEKYFESVDKVDDYTLRIVGTQPSWRPLYDYSLWPTPAHKTVIDKDWVDRTTNEIPVVAGAYVISNTVRGESITFKRVPNWWGDKSKYFQGVFNFDEIHLRVIPTDRELDYVRQGELDITTVSSKVWNENLDFPAIENGWLRKSRIFIDVPSGLHGLVLNLQAPIFQNKDFRTALQYLVNFDRINRNLMYASSFRKRSFFDGTPFADPSIGAPEFNPAKAREYLERAGYHRPNGPDSKTFLSKVRNVISGLLFTRTDTDEILVNDKGERASFTVLYRSKQYEPHFTVMQQDFRRVGVDMKLQLLDAGTMFERASERKYEAVHVAMLTNFYPDPRQYLHTEFGETTGNNNFWGYKNPEVDAEIEIYEKNLDPDARTTAMHRIDQIIRGDSIYIPFWDAPYTRLVYWDYLQFPDFYLPKRTQQFVDWLVYWIDPAKKAALEEAKSKNTPYPLDPDPDKDYFHVRDKLQ